MYIREERWADDGADGVWAAAVVECRGGEVEITSRDEQGKPCRT